jgi:putative transcriptional regulator
VSPAANPSDDHHDIVVHLGDVLDDRGMTLTQLAERVGVTIANLSILKNGRAKAMRFTTLTAICRELDCQPGDLLAYRPSEPGGAASQDAGGAGRTASSAA